MENPTVLDVLGWWYALDVITRVEVCARIRDFNAAFQSAGAINPPQWAIDAVLADPKLMEVGCTPNSSTRTPPAA